MILNKFLLISVILSFNIYATDFDKECNKKNSVNVDVNGMVCDFCARALEKVFKKKHEVDSIKVDLNNGKIAINFNDGFSLDNSKIKKLVTDSGYDVVKINRCTDG